MSLRKRRLMTASIQRTIAVRSPLQLTSLEDRTAPAVFTVTNTDDAGIGSLRAAINSANLTAGADSIAFDGTVFATAKTISLSGGEIAINDTLSIQGTGPNLLRIENTRAQSSSSRVFNINNSATLIDVTLNQFTISGGDTITETILSTEFKGSGGGVAIGKANVTLTNMIVENNKVAANINALGYGGGAIAISSAASTLTLNSTVIRNNAVSGALGDGGAIHLITGSTVNINSSTISGNTATDDGGAAYFFDGGTLNIVNSTISGNSAGSANAGNRGGALYFFTYSTLTATITNSTISGNTAGNGGAIDAGSPPVSITLQNSTVANNIATVGIGGISRPQGVGAPGKTALISTILAANTGPIARDTEGAVRATNSLIGAANLLTITGGANQTGTELTPLDPLLLPLADNGGQTKTHGLRAESLAVDGGSNLLSLGADQRGQARVFGIAADIGAYELIPNTVTSITSAAAPGPTNAATVNYTITFNGPTTNLTASNLSLTTTGTAAGVIGTPTSTDNIEWTVPITSITGSGSIQLRIVNTTDILPGLAGTPPFTGPTIAVDRVAPTVTSITRTNPNPTGLATVSWNVTFSETVQNVGLANFTLTTTGVTGASLTSVTQNGNIWTVTANTGSGDGTAQLSLTSAGTIRDAAGNAISGGVPTVGPSYSIQKVAPAVVSISRSSATPTDATSVSWSVLFSKPVTGVTASAFELVVSNSKSTAAITSVAGSGTSYTVTASTGSLDTDLRLDLTEDTPADVAGNKLSNIPFTGETYNADRQAATIASFTNVNPVNTNSNNVSWTITFTRPVTGLALSNFTLSGSASPSLTSLSGSGTTYTLRAASGSVDGTITARLANSTGVTDNFGRAVGSLPANSVSYTVDRTAPVVTSIVRIDDATNNNTSLAWTVTFSEALASINSKLAVPVASNGVIFRNVTVAPSSTSTPTSTVVIVTVSGVSGNGTLNLGINETLASDVAGNAGSSFSKTFSSGLYTIDQTRPTVTVSAGRTSTKPTFPVSIVLSEPLTSFGPGSVTVGNGTISEFTQISDTEYTFTANATTAGDVEISVADGVGVDAFGNTNRESNTVITNVNTLAPTLTVAPASSAIATQDDRTYTVTFSEPVTGFDATKLSLINGTVESFTAVSSTVYRFVVSAVNDGTVGGTIVAGAGRNNLNVPSAATALPTFVVDRTQPTVAISSTSTTATRQPITFTITFSEAVTGLRASDLVLSGSATTGQTPAISLTGSGRSYTASVSGVRAGTLTISVPEGVAVDQAGNSNRASANASTSFSPPIRQFALGAGSGGVSQILNPNGSVSQASNYFEADYTSGVRVASADFTGDGIEDIVVATGPGAITNVRIFDGKTGDQLFNFQPFEDDFTGGVYVAVGDMDGDTVPDLLISPDEGGGPRVRGIRGAGFTQLFDFFGIQDPAFRGGARAAAADLNGDGRAELIVSAGFGGGPRVTIWDGLDIIQGNTESSIANFFAFEPELRNGSYVSAADIDGDGLNEIVFGAGPGGGPRVRIFEASALLTPDIFTVDQVLGGQVFDAFAGDVTNRSGIRVLAKDIDGDGFAEVITGGGEGAGSRVTAYAGSSIKVNTTPVPLFDFDAFPGSTSGIFVG